MSCIFQTATNTELKIQILVDSRRAGSSTKIAVLGLINDKYMGTINWTGMEKFDKPYLPNGYKYWSNNNNTSRQEKY